MTTAADGEQAISLSMMPASRRERWRTYTVLLLSLMVFAAVVPFARVQLPPFPAFISIYESALALNDIFTAILLLSQFSVLRTRALLVLGGGYLFTAFIIIPHALSFPGLFTAGGLLGAGSQTTAWLYMIWHGGFPLAVIGYALVKGREPEHPNGRAWPSIVLTLAIVAAIVTAVTLLTTKGHDLLPVIIENNGFNTTMTAVSTTIWLLSFAALAILWISRPHTVLDLWLMVVMGAWLSDVGLSAVFDVARFDVGWYAGRIYGFMAASSLLAVLLLETGALYARFVRAIAIEQRERERNLREAQEKLIHLSRVSELGQMVSALAHEVRQPLAAVSSYLRATDQLMQFGETGKVQAGLERAAEQAARATQLIDRLRDFVKKGEPIRRNEDLAAAIEEVAALALVGTEGQKIKLELHLHPRAWLASFDKISIQQVLLSLIKNAVEAVRDSAERTIVVSTAPIEAGMIEIRVTDSGGGIAPEVRARLFQPFVTTKPNGIGVGLSICRSIVEQHGGRIGAAESGSGGATFCFTIPRGEEDDSVLPAYVRDLLSPGRVQTISSSD